MTTQRTYLPDEDIIIIDRDVIVSTNPLTHKGSLYIESDTLRCKLGTGDRYNSVSYTPWSIAAGVSSSSITSVSDILTELIGLDTSHTYIWGGNDIYTHGYILSYSGSTWIAEKPADNSIAGVASQEKLLFWDGVEWNDVTGTGSFFMLSDVKVSDPYEGDLFALNGDGQLENIRPSQLPLDSRYITVPIVMEGRLNHLLFSNGMSGSFTNGIKTDDMNRPDMNYNAIKNARIDCGVYYG